MLKVFYSNQKQLHLSANFTVGDVWADSGLNELHIDDALISVLEQIFARFGVKPLLRNVYGAAGTAYKPVASASWRPKGTTYHRYTTALDVYVPGVTAYALAHFVEGLDTVAGIGVYSASRDELKHIHVDVKRSGTTSKNARTKRTCWWIKTSGSKTPGHGGIPCTFKSGSRSLAVMDIQEKLNTLGYKGKKGKNLAVDGDFGANTNYALKAYQKANGLKADGVYGTATERAMGVFGWKV
jgi:hypothetical protein